MEHIPVTVVAFCLTFCGAATPMSAKDIDWKGVSKERTDWVEQCLKDFESIKVGMTRGELDKKFPLAGGIQGASPARYIHPACPYFHIDVEFDFKRESGNQGAAITSHDDKVIRVSKPYIERPGWD